MDQVLLQRLAETLLLPPTSSLLLLLLAWPLRRRGRWRNRLVATGLLSLYLASLGPVAGGLMASLERTPAIPPDRVPELRQEAEAIVALGGGRRYDAPEYGRDALSDHSLARLHYAAWLHRRSGLPLLLSGGAVDPGREAEARVMARVLEEHYALRPRWIEDRSRTTEENALHSARLLASAGIERIVLVTEAFHMPRAAAVFRRQGLEVVPAPTAFHKGGGATSEGAWKLLPRAGNLRSTNLALHEWMGWLWYRLRGSID